MKKIICGVIIGVVACLGFQSFASSINAALATFEVYVAGQKFVSDKPVLSVDGSTYLPLKAIADALGTKVEWNANQKRVEIGMEPSQSSAMTPTPIQTPKPTDFIKTYKGEFIDIEMIGSRQAKDEEFPQVSSNQSKIIALKIRVINKTNASVLLNKDDFRGIYELKDAPASLPWVQSKINLNKGSKIFETPIEDPGFWKSVELLSFKFDRLQPGEVREGVIGYSSWFWNKTWHGLKYKDTKLIFDEFHSF